MPRIPRHLDWRLTALAGCAAVFLWGSAVASEPRTGPRPNILIFMADDQYRSSVGCYGATPSHTPTIDRLASEGVRMTRCFTPSSICTPNRAAFLSGMLPLKNGAHANHSGFHDGVKSLPNFMRALGYRACLINKDGIRKPSDVYAWEFRILESDRLTPGATNPNSKRHRMTRFDELEQFLASSDSRPFCILHASRQPHTPFLGRLPNGLEGYDASNFTMDSEFGRDLALLDKHGLTGSTVVIYVNDNEANQPRTKYTLYDTALMVPCIVRWPGHVQAGTTSSATVSFLDFLPTLVELAGGQPDSNWDGRSMVDLWEGKTQRHHDNLYFSYTGVSLGSKRDEVPFPIRAYRTDRYKYIRNLNHRVGHPKQDNMQFPPEELYDLHADPAEMHNLAESSEHQQQKRALAAEVDRWMKRTGDLGIASEVESLRRYPPGD
jgi:N-sulfoglucosamine sulfohydrolase